MLVPRIDGLAQVEQDRNQLWIDGFTVEVVEEQIYPPVDVINHPLLSGWRRLLEPLKLARECDNDGLLSIRNV